LAPAHAVKHHGWTSSPRFTPFDTNHVRRKERSERGDVGHKCAGLLTVYQTAELSDRRPWPAESEPFELGFYTLFDVAHAR